MAGELWLYLDENTRGQIWLANSSPRSQLVGALISYEAQFFGTYHRIE